MLKLGSLQFEVESAEFTGHFSDGKMNKRMQCGEVPSFEWNVKIETIENDFITSTTDDCDDDEFYESVSPSLYFNDGFSLPVKSYKDIEGLTVNWDSTVNDKGENAGFLCVFEHEDITSGKIEFLKRDGDTFYIRWSGTANIYWNDEYGEDVPFQFEGNVAFAGITAHCDEISEKSTLLQVMNHFIDLEDFECTSERVFEITNGKSTQWHFTLK